ncbi:MAG: metallophosphoesterase [Halobacteria archaeon]|nr:metallophosphoesterase [Halobacteria archaeon]
MSIEFSDEVERVHERIDSDGRERIYVVGDVHGCIEELRVLLDEIRPSSDDLLVFVGDLIRKGPNSDAVVDLIRTSKNMVSVRGNNEQKIIDGGVEAGLSDTNRDYLESMPVVISWDDAMVVHDGVDPRKELVDHTIRDLVKMRSLDNGGYDGEFWFDRYDSDTTVFFGHTVLEDPFVGNAVGLDTGCVYGGRLTAYDVKESEFVSVPANKTYSERSDEYIVSVPEERTR